MVIYRFSLKCPVQLLKASIERILIDAGPLAAKTYKQTPLDFVKDLCPSWSLNVQAFMGRRGSPRERPIPRLGNDRFPNLAGWQETILCAATVSYASIHLLDWNFTFLTRIKLIPWRIYSILLFGNTVVFWISRRLQHGSAHFAYSGKPS